MPALTVLLTVGDRAEAAAATARDLLGQSFGDLEILLLAGEATGELPGLVGDDPRIRVVPIEAAGAGEALNRGLELAQGPLIARAVPGDISVPDRLERQAGLLRAAANLAFVATGWRSIGPDGGIGRVVTPPAGDAALRAAMAGGDAIGHPTATMRRDAVVAAGGWRPAFLEFEDYDLLLRLMDRHAGACTPEALVDYIGRDDMPGWQVLQQRIFSEMASVAAHDRRQAGRPDYGDRASAADRTLLHKMGLVDAEITQSVTGRALAMALAAGAAGRWSAMREAARLGLRQQDLPGAARSRFVGLWLRSLARLRPPDADLEAPPA